MYLYLFFGMGQTTEQWLPNDQNLMKADHINTKNSLSTFKLYRMIFRCGDDNQYITLWCNSGVVDKLFSFPTIHRTRESRKKNFTANFNVRDIEFPPRNVTMIPLLHAGLALSRSWCLRLISTLGEKISMRWEWNLTQDFTHAKLWDLQK